MPNITGIPNVANPSLNFEEKAVTIEPTNTPVL